MPDGGAGRSDRKRWRALRWLRRASQAAFLGLFLALIAATAALTGAGFDAASSARVRWPVEAFLDIDPLAGAVVLLATGTVAGAMIFGLVTLASAALLGRAFCGWACPLGALNQLVSEIRPFARGKRRIASNATKPYQKAKYVILAAVLGAALLGSAAGGVLDPLSLVTRGVSLVLLPWIEWALGGVMDAASGSHVAGVQRLADNAYRATGSLLAGRGLIYGGGFAIGVLFVAILAVNRWVPRFWCRGLCPLGAMLGASGRFGMLLLDKDAERCDQCGLCQMACQGAASPRPGERWQRAECDLCMNCVAACPHGAIAFRLAGRTTDEQPLPDLGRRAVLAGAAAGVALVPAMRAGALGSGLGRPDPACIRPPGSRDEDEFLSRCIRCGQCMKICPRNALHPALDEAGVEGLWTPVLVPRIGYCEPTCTLCTQVCPTGAIRTITENEKLGRSGASMVRIGTAFIDQGRCLPWAMGTPCMVCEEFCPTSPKAVWTREEEVDVRDLKVKVRRPYVDPAACNGCGACEFACPVYDRAAIRVTAAGESRAPGHELLLRPASPKRPK
ncbi:MAG: 4Fe-4S binding protein [Deltaproteobacteria bacterium]|nr:4Fe-4S binding protein [Deltaproteobacteria bacterium]